MGKRKAPPDTSHFTWVEDHVAAASLAYKQDNLSGLSDKIKLSKGWSFLKTIDGATGVRLKIWVSNKNGNVLVGFRGTSSLKEAKLDLTAGSIGFKNANGQDMGNVWKGFGMGFEDIKDALGDELRVLKDMGYLPKGSVLQFAGHSLGGALSEIASTYYASAMPTIQVVETSIGAPTTGDKIFGEYSRSLPNLSRTRIVADGDHIGSQKLPGMDYTEKRNVIDFRSRKNRKTNLWDVARAAAKASVTLSSMGAAALLEGAELKGNHSLDNYEKVLMEDFQENRIDSVTADQEYMIQENEEAYQQAQESEDPVTSAICRCDCHLHDQALDNEEIPPESTGNVMQMETPNDTLQMNTVDVPLMQTQNAMNQTIQQTENMTDIYQKRVQEKSVILASQDELMTMIQTSLDAQAEKEKEKMTKLQERYAYLTNQQESDMDDIDKERETFQKSKEDIQYFQDRIQFELEHPEYVQDDDYDSKTQAVKFKNRMNQLYSMILSASTKQRVAQKTAKDKPDEDNIERDVDLDQIEQRQGAQEHNTLTADIQSGDFVYDVSKLSDLDTGGPESEKQLLEWLNYPGTTARGLYETLKSSMTAQYQKERFDFLRTKEQDKRKTAAQNIKAQLENYHNQQGTGTHDVMMQKRAEFFKALGSNSQFQELMKTNPLDMNTLISKYQKEGDDLTIMNDLFGYDPRDVDKSVSQLYQNQIMRIPTDIPPEERGKLIQDVWKTYQLNKSYPWVNSETFQSIYKQYKDDPVALQKELEKQRHTLPTSYLPQEEDTSGFNATLLEKNVQDLANNTKDIVQTQMKDYFSEYRKDLEASFQNEDAVKKMFKEWNPGSLSEKVLETTKDVVSYIPILNSLTGTVGYSYKKHGWYDKRGNYLGEGASPDFEDYAKKHPELGYTFYKNEKNLVDTIFDAAGTAGNSLVGIDPREALDSITGKAAKYVDSMGQIRDNQDAYGGQDEGGMNPFYLMSMASSFMGGGGSDKNDHQEMNLSSKMGKHTGSSSKKTGFFGKVGNLIKQL